jgi:hypothetical protein
MELAERYDVGFATHSNVDREDIEAHDILFGRRPIERFEASLGDASAEVRRRFYCDNFLDLMGAAGAALAA